MGSAGNTKDVRHETMGVTPMLTNIGSSHLYFDGQAVVDQVADTIGVMLAGLRVSACISGACHEPPRAGLRRCLPGVLPKLPCIRHE